MCDNSPTTAVTTPATIATTPNSTMNTGTMKLRDAHSRSVSAGSYSDESLFQAAFACLSSWPQDLMYSSGGRTYPIACSRVTECRGDREGKTAYGSHRRRNWKRTRSAWWAIGAAMYTF